MGGKRSGAYDLNSLDGDGEGGADSDNEDAIFSSACVVFSPFVLGRLCCEGRGVFLAASKGECFPCCVSIGGYFKGPGFFPSLHLFFVRRGGDISCSFCWLIILSWQLVEFKGLSMLF